ncbi:MAG: FapA family protein [Methylomonas sp.]|nr:FapA family protein [Methylomonas sp.]
MNDAPSTSKLIFKLNDDGDKLLALYEAGETKPTLNHTMIMETLSQQGLTHLFLNESAIEDLLHKYDLNESFELEIGERQDGSCAIEMDSDNMSASLTLTPPYGGTPVILAQVRQALQEKGIVSGILDQEIEQALKDGEATDLVIAQGLHPVPGVDAHFESLIPEIRECKPHIDEHGFADFHDLGQFIVVKQGEPLMRRIPPSEGTKGLDITGRILEAKAGKDAYFAAKLQGAEIDPNDGNLLLASIAGQPKLMSNGVIVDPIINLPAVDLSTGNVDFDGTINIKGNVRECMKIKASGDVFVGGTVEAAEIEAGGNIVIKGGVIGHSEHKADKDEAHAFSAKLISKGSISARFAENTQMDAGMDIMIEELSMHNHLTALNQIVIGKSGGKKGRIVGGMACASTLVKAPVIGSNAGAITKIKVGFNPHLQAQFDQLKLDIEANEKKQEEIKKIVAFVSANPKKNVNGLLGKVVNTREKLEADCAQLHDECKRVLSEMTAPEHVQVIVDEAVFSNTEIQIGTIVCKNNVDRGKGVFQIVDGEIEFSLTLFNTDG